jgi:probable HAF family extracellular repeat protein
MVRLRHVVVMVVAGCSHNPAAPTDAADDATSTDGVPSVDGATSTDDTTSTNDAGIDAAGPPVVCTATKINAPSSNGVRANAIDGAGNIAGSYLISAGDAHAFRWNASSGFVDLGTLGGGFADALGISGEITVGSSTVAPGDIRGFISDASGMRDLPLPAGAHHGHAFGVNASGIAVGDATFPDGSVHALKYEGGMAIDLGTLPDRRNSTALAISDSGVIVGTAYNGGPSDQTAVMWVNGSITSLGPGTATAVDAAGDIAVGGITEYRGGGATRLGVPRGGHVCAPAIASGTVLGVNDAGWIVGFVHCQVPEGTGFDRPTIYVDGAAWDLADLVTPLSSQPPSARASAINTAGQIALTSSGGPISPLFGVVIMLTCTRP